MPKFRIKKPTPQKELEKLIKKISEQYLKESVEQYLRQIQPELLQKVVSKIDMSKLKGVKGDSIKGDKGDFVKGDDGKNGVDGIDGKTPIKNIDFFDGEKGSDGIEIKPNEVIQKINSAKDKINKSRIDGLEEQLKLLSRSIREKRISKGGGMGNVFSETPVGNVNGSNDTFTLTNKPKNNALLLFVNGQLQRATNEYALSDKTITFNASSIPQGGELFAWYIR